MFAAVVTVGFGGIVGHVRLAFGGGWDGGLGVVG